MSVSTFLLDNSGSNVDYIDVATNSDPYLDFGTGDYEIEFAVAIDYNNSVYGSQPWTMHGISMILFWDTTNYTNASINWGFGSGVYLAYDVPFSEINNQFMLLNLSRTDGTTTLRVDTGLQVYSQSMTTAYNVSSNSNDFRFGQSSNLKADIAYATWTKAGVLQLRIDPTGISGPMADANIIRYHHNGTTTQAPAAFPFTVRNVSGSIPCFGEGTQILTIENEEEKYVAVEKLVEGSVVKTYKHGARKIAKIVTGSFINDPQEPKRCMYKLPKTDAMTNDLILTGGHAVLVDESPKGLQFKIDDKYLSFAENNADFVKIDDHQIYKYYNFSMENDGDKDRRFGVWANGVLCETPSEKQLESFESL
jgi:hypothetical protein